MVNSMSIYLTGFLTKVWPGARHVLDYLSGFAFGF